jgi:hypothetical protein
MEKSEDPIGSFFKFFIVIMTTFYIAYKLIKKNK